LPIWEAQWAHPEQYSNPYLLRNIAREGNLAMSAREWMGKAEFWYPGSAWIPRFPALPDSPGRAGKAGVQVEPGHQKTAEKAVWTCAQAAIFVQAVRDYFENKQ
jgi:hypothetical protein